MLPANTKRVVTLLESLRQTNVTDHFKFTEAKPEERVPPYTQMSYLRRPLYSGWWRQIMLVIIFFRDSLGSFEHLTTTIQPISAFDHPAFQEMMSVASHTTRGIKLPSRRQT
jgi:hypothetical protein